MGTLSHTSTCGPDGSTIVTIDGILGHTLITGPGEHTAIWWKPGTTERIPENIWGQTTITVPALTDCAVPTTTAPPTTLLPVPSTISETPGTTAPAPPSTIDLCLGQDFDQPTGTWACWPTTVPPEAGLDTTAVVTVPPTLPATGASEYGPELLVGGALLAVGLSLVAGIRWIRRVA